MSLYDSRLYMEDIKRVACCNYKWEMLRGKSVVISGGTGMIGSFIVDVLMYQNEVMGLETHVYVIGRSKKKAWDRFGSYMDCGKLHFVCHDINEPLDISKPADLNGIDYVIHAASNTHPAAYASDPIGTISANVLGTKYLLDFAEKAGCKRFVFLSSVEIYGENKGDTDKFAEDYLGYIDCNTLRAGYPESKRTGEALCQAYRKQHGLDVVIPRLSRTYGPTMLLSDTKAISQFILKGAYGENIVLKSEGMQLYSYVYVADAASAIIKLMLEGENGQAYNIASDASDLTLRELAKVIADYVGKRVVYELPDKTESAGYSKATKALLDCQKLKGTGWTPLYDMSDGLIRTIDIVKEITN
ncbi:MAG: NAD-dependent epimerase/dehydratase family protein [Clostridium sp.]|nr:NAD-dependent epimerase/dehydratase family protein [Clostridium sp.]MCM1207369.1 NAD-dependent epimerase/dehydratase family protein [Ruminococcus sp.]